MSLPWRCFCDNALLAVTLTAFVELDWNRNANTLSSCWDLGRRLAVRGPELHGGLGPGGATAKPVNSDTTAEKQESVEVLYNKAAATLDEGKYFEAAKQFDDVDRQYPYSQWAARAQLMAGFAHYKNLKYDEAVLALDRYIELHDVRGIDGLKSAASDVCDGWVTRREINALVCGRRLRLLGRARDIDDVCGNLID